MAKTKNIYILDTCVLLHDPECIYKFEEHDIYIPLACIDDLDEIKTKRDSTGYAARQVFRNLDQHSIQEMSRGVLINDSKGKLFIFNGEAPLTKNEQPMITRINSDNAIINTALRLKSSFPKKKVVIVSKDTGLRVRATSWGCLAENYKSDLLHEGELYSGYRIVPIEDQSDWELLIKRQDICDLKSLKCHEKLHGIFPNEFICFQYGHASILAWYNCKQIKIFDDKKQQFMGVVGKNMEQKFALKALENDDIPLVCLSGPAGSGKTMLALAVGLEKHNEGRYDKIFVMKPTIPVGGKDIGYLPGSKLEKLSAWLGPIKDNISQLSGFSLRDQAKFGGNSFEEMVMSDVIEAEALAFIQGRSIPNSFIILDEAENVSPKEARMVIERCGKGSKVVLIGDLSQIENPYLDKNSCGLSHAINGGREHELTASITLTKVERSALSAIASTIFNAK